MYFRLAKKFTDGSTLYASQLNNIVDKINELGGELSLYFIDGNRLSSSNINEIINKVNSIIPSNLIQELNLSISEGNTLFSNSLNIIVDKINEIIDYLNNYKEDVYSLYIMQKSATINFPSSGGSFIIDAYITKNGEFSEVIRSEQIQSSLSNTQTENEGKTIVFNVPENIEDQEKEYYIEINTPYETKNFTIYQKANIPEQIYEIRLFVSELSFNEVPIEGGEVQYTVSIQQRQVGSQNEEDWENYTTNGITLYSTYPYGIVETYIDNGKERVYTIKFDENKSFKVKDYKANISSYIENSEKSLRISQKVNSSIYFIEVFTKTSNSNIEYNNTQLLCDCYVKVNGNIITDDRINNISSKIIIGTSEYNMLPSFNNNGHKYFTYLIEENTEVENKIFKTYALYSENDKEEYRSDELTITQKGRRIPNYSININPSNIIEAHIGDNIRYSVTFSGWEEGDSPWKLYIDDELVDEIDNSNISNQTIRSVSGPIGETRIISIRIYHNEIDYTGNFQYQIV